VTLDEVDRVLERLGADSDRMAERLVRLDGHQGHRLLDSASLTADNQRRWAAAKVATAALWANFEAYRSALAQARTLRGQRQRLSDADLAKLASLLGGRSVELPADDRSLSPEWVSFDELTSRMNDDYATVIALVTRAADAWSTLAHRLDPPTALLGTARSTAGELGMADDAELVAVADGLARLQHQLGSADPLVEHPDLDGALRAIAARLDRVVERLATVQRLKAGYPEQRDALVERIAQVEAAERDAADLHGTVRAKIAAAGPAPAPGAAAALRTGVVELDELHDGQEWTLLARRFERLDAQVADARAAAVASREGLQQLLDRRAELRGRLAAYRAKAGRLGHGEDDTLRELHRRAHDLLWAAPCDLAAATRALNGYQQAVLVATGQQRGEVAQ